MSVSNQHQNKHILICYKMLTSTILNKTTILFPGWKFKKLKFTFILFVGDVKKQWKSAMKKYHPPPEMHILPQSNHYINNNSQQRHVVSNSIHGVLKKPPQYQVLEPQSSMTWPKTWDQCNKFTIKICFKTFTSIQPKRKSHWSKSTYIIAYISCKTSKLPV